MYLFFLMEKLSLLLQDLFIELRVKQEAATLSLRQRRAEVSETLLEMILRDGQLKSQMLRDIISYKNAVAIYPVLL